MRIKKFVFIILLFVHSVCAFRYSLAVYPLVNQSRDSLYDWVSDMIPEFFSRNLSEIEGIRVWDPVFMFQTDSLGWRMTSDSLQFVHCARWGWDAAVGGAFEVTGDSVRIDLKIVWVTGTRQHIVMKLSRMAGVSEVAKHCPDLLLSVCSLLKIEIASADSVHIRNGREGTAYAYRTFCRGYGLEMNGNYSEALTAYNHAIELDPTFILARCRSGGIYLRTGNVADAARVFRSVLNNKHHTKHTLAMTAEFAVDNYPPGKSRKILDKYRTGLEATASGLTVMGKWYMSTGEYQRAIALFRRAIAWGPSDLETEFMLAVTNMLSGEYQAATELLNHLITVRPDYMRYQVSLGAVYRKDGRYMESLAILEAAYKKEPDNTMVLVELAHTFFALTWYRKAGQMLELAHRMKPDDNDILVDLGIVYWHEKKVADSERCFTLAEKVDKGRRAVMVNVGNMYLEQGDIRQAIKAYRSAGKSGERNAEILYNLALAYMRKGNRKAAARYLDQLLQLTPGRVDLLVIRAQLARRFGKNGDAEMAYHKILENDPYYDMAVEGLASLLIEEKKYEEAIYQVESYLEVKPARGDFMMLLGDAYRAQGWYEVALVKYELVTQAFPDYAPGYLGMARCLVDMVRYKNFQRYDEVIYALKNASGRDPKNPEPDDLMGDIYWSYKQNGNKAIECWTKALTKTTDAHDRKRIARKLQKAGRK